MAPEHINSPEIESFNLADLDVTALDNRLELTTMIPQYIYCNGYCAANGPCGVNCTVDCGTNTGCVCHADA